MNSAHQSNDFFERVLDTVKQIPYGRVTTYGAIARFLGATKSSRAVGYALNTLGGSNRDEIPAHRVVNRLGMLSGKVHFVEISMEELLNKEGILVKDDKIVNFDNLFWDPEELLK